MKLNTRQSKCAKLHTVKAISKFAIKLSLNIPPYTECATWWNKWHHFGKAAKITQLFGDDVS